MITGPTPNVEIHCEIQLVKMSRKPECERIPTQIPTAPSLHFAVRSSAFGRSGMLSPSAPKIGPESGLSITASAEPPTLGNFVAFPFIPASAQPLQVNKKAPFEARSSPRPIQPGLHHFSVSAKGRLLQGKVSGQLVTLHPNPNPTHIVRGLGCPRLWPTVIVTQQIYLTQNKHFLGV